MPSPSILLSSVSTQFVNSVQSACRPHFQPVEYRENWLFSRYSTGWKCGLHADWTELTNCVDTELNKIEGEGIKRRYFYVTIIKDPVARYLSEFKHVQRGATWRGARHWCGGIQANI